MTKEQARVKYGAWVNQPNSPLKERILTECERVLDTGNSFDYDPYGNGYELGDPKGMEYGW